MPCWTTRTGTPIPTTTYSGVPLQNSNLDGRALADVDKLSFRVTGTATAGSPRLSLPIDTGSGTTAFYAFVSAYDCNDGAGLVDALNDSTCTTRVASRSRAGQRSSRRIRTGA